MGVAMKVKRLRVSPFALVEGLKPGRFEVVRDPLPSDARLVSVHLDNQTGDIMLFVESAEFQDIPNYQILPELQNVYIRQIGEG